MLKPIRVYLPLSARAEARVQSSISMWTSFRRACAEIALSARERGDGRAAAQAQTELIHCELKCASYERQLALLRGHAGGILHGAGGGAAPGKSSSPARSDLR
jgi:hypothetical protein